MPGLVTVFCKLPCGLTLQVYKMEDVDEPVMGGGVKTVRRSRGTTGTRVKVAGFAEPMLKRPTNLVVHGVGITRDVDADFWNAWLKQNEDADYVKNGLVWASPKQTDIEAPTRDKVTLKSGMEAVDPGHMPIEFRRITTATTTDLR